MKILITHVYSEDNKGDAAILSVLLKELSRVFKNPLIWISTMRDTKEIKTFDGYPLISSFSSLALLSKKGPIHKLIAIFYIVCCSLLWGSIYRFLNKKPDVMLTKELKKLLHHFASSDLIVPVGGGYLRGKNNLEENINIVLLLLPIFVAILLKKPIVLHSQSIGPFGNRFQQAIVGFGLRHVDGILIREDYSLETTQKLNIPGNLIHRTVDAGFLFATGERISLQDIGITPNTSNTTIVGITVRNWLPFEQQDNYEEAVAAFADYLIVKRQCSVIFISQVTAPMFSDDDRLTARRVLERMQSRKHVWNLTEKYSQYEIKAIYTNLDYLVGTRLHSVILSLTSNIPAIAIEYEHKTGGVFKDLQLSEWVVKIEDVTPIALSNLFDKLVPSREKYLKTLQKTLPVYIHSAEQAAQTVQKIYRKKEGKLNYDKSN